MKSVKGRMFPTPVGMNRDQAQRYLRQSHVPHTRGDEPHRADSVPGLQ